MNSVVPPQPSLSEVFDQHPFYVYQDRLCREGVAMNLLRFAYMYFCRTELFLRRSFIKKFSAEFSSNNPPSMSPDLQALIGNSLLDSVMLMIFFENYLKAEFLIGNYLIHTIDKSAQESLSKQQKSEPIPVAELANFKPKTIEVVKDGHRYHYPSYSGLNPHTLKVSTLITYIENGYLQKADSILAFFREVNEARNSLHLLDAQTFKLGKHSFAYITQIIDVINSHIVPKHNEFVKHFNLGEAYKITELSY